MIKRPIDPVSAAHPNIGAWCDRGLVRSLALNTPYGDRGWDAIGDGMRSRFGAFCNAPYIDWGWDAIVSLRRSGMGCDRALVRFVTHPTLIGVGVRSPR